MIDNILFKLKDLINYKIEIENNHNFYELNLQLAFLHLNNENMSYAYNNKLKNKIKKTQEITYEKINKDDTIINVYDVDENKIKKMNMEEYLYGVLSSEMPSTFDEEALKAQAVAARTYVIYKIENNIKSGHKGADICTNSSHCQAYTSYENLKNIKGKDWMDSDYVKVKKAIDIYDEEMEKYLKKIGRYEKEVNWSIFTSKIYNSVYYPNVKESINKQGFKN